MSGFLVTRVIDGVICHQDGRPLSADELQRLVDMANERARHGHLAALESQARAASDLGPLVRAAWSADEQAFVWEWADGSGAMPESLVSDLRARVLLRRAEAAGAASQFATGAA